MIARLSNSSAKRRSAALLRLVIRLFRDLANLLGFLTILDGTDPRGCHRTDGAGGDWFRRQGAGLAGSQNLVDGFEYLLMLLEITMDLIDIVCRHRGE